MVPMSNREVTGSLFERSGRYTAVLNLYDKNGKRSQKSVALGIPVGSNFIMSFSDSFSIEKFQFTLANYQNQMGVGQVNAARLLNAVSGNGKQVSFPNLYNSLGKEVKAIPANYFLGGETLTYTVSIADTAVATASMEGAKLKAGTTKASITSSKGETHNFNITVRKTANGNGWL